MHSPTSPVSENGHASAHGHTHAAPVVISPAFEAEADRWISHYPVSKRSASLPLLHFWQETYGYVSEQGIEWIAAKLSLQPIHILELVTFYPMFRLHPVGRIQIKVCRTLSCALAGSYRLAEHLRNRCGVQEPDAHGVAVSKDGTYSVEFVECLASCGTGPVVMINDDFHEAVTPQKADALVQIYKMEDPKSDSK